MKFKLTEVKHKLWPINNKVIIINLCVVINVLTYVNQNRNHLAVLDFST